MKMTSRMRPMGYGQAVREFTNINTLRVTKSAVTSITFSTWQFDRFQDRTGICALKPDARRPRLELFANQVRSKRTAPTQ
ncbi:hypothetical protein ABBQ38_010369 [Trebouxia sp. C0009 RCD-2024]